MDESRTDPKTARRSGRKRVWRALAILLLLLVVFHRPILLGIGRRVAIHYAAKENLKLDCRLEGSVFGNLIIRNLHIVSTGPSAVELVDADYIRSDYSLLDWWREGMSELVKNVELRNVSAVLDPAKAPVTPKPPRPDKPIRLPEIFPQRLRLTNVNLLIRAPSAAQNLVLENFDLDLNPKTPGEMHIAKLQLPSVAPWTRITGKTSYTNRNLILSDLVLDEQNQIRRLSVDASRIKEKQLALTLDGTIVGGTTSGAVALSETAKSVEMQTRIALENISLETLGLYVGLTEGAFSGTINKAQVVCSGAIDSPRTWTGTIAADISNLKRGDVSLDHVSLDLAARNSVANIVAAEVTRGSNKLSLSGNVTLPGDIREFGRAPLSLQMSGDFPELQTLTAGMPQSVSGSAKMEGRADIADATLRVALNFTAGAIEWSGGSAQGAQALFTASKKMQPPNAKKPYFADLQTETHFEAAQVQSHGFIFDSAKGVAKSQDDLLTVDTVDVTRAQNVVNVHGTYHLPADFLRARFQPADIAISMNAAQLADYWMGEAMNKISGPLQVNGEIQIRDGVANGSISIYGKDLRARNLVIRELSSQVAVYRNVVYLNDLTATLSGQDFVRASGQFGIEKPFHYKGSVAVNISDLSQFKPLLAAIGNKNELAGSLVLDWSGSGQAVNFNNSGEVKLALEKGRYANLQSLQARVEGTYAPDGLSVPIIFFGSDKMLFQADGESNGTTLEISRIQIDQGKSKYATGYASVPFIWKNIGSDKPVFDPNGKVAVSFQSENLDLKKLFEDIGVKGLGSGLVSVKLDAGGTLSNMTARLDLQARELRSPQAPTFEPATFDLTAQMQNNQLAVNGKIQQAKVQPISITANLPLNVGRILDEKKFDENTPVTAKVNMPRSSVNFVRQFVPALERVDGDLALDVNVGGTVAKPVLSGTGDTKINFARFSNPTLPALTNFTARLAFANDTLNLENFRGELAGGPFVVTGRITFPKLTQPNLDLQLKADAVLVARNDDLTARADANLRVAGPLTSASVNGNVAITNSQFLKNIDLIPIGLPGRPAPGPKPPADTREFSFPNPPLRDWKFDVAIKTKDAFLIRGNLANGGALVDMKLTGTGAQPKLDGSVRLQNVEATLPFSRLEIQHGLIYFNPVDPFNPGIDLQGTSLVRDHTVHVYVYGTANEPQAIFSSEPPLPQEEIISLLATGTTREELLSGGNVLAGRAVMLLGQELYRKVFKKGQATKPNSVFDKLQVDVGNVDPRTGQQTATARFRVNEKVQLIGDIGVQGDFRGTVKYLIRFR